MDAAKGLAIVLVVLFHSVLFLHANELTAGAWRLLNGLLDTFRMPLFFLASGLFAGRSLTRPWSELFRSKIALFLYLYALWSVIRFAVFQVVPWTLPSTDAGDLRNLLLAFVWPSSGLWYIYALAIFFVIIRASHGRISPRVQIIAALVLAAVAGGGVVQTGNTGWDKMALNLVFFLAGCHASRAILVQWAPRLRSLPLLLALGVCFVAATGGAYVAGLSGVVGVRLALSVLAVIVGVGVAVHLSTLPRSWDLFGYLGQRTLPIYLVHYLVIAAAVVTLDKWVTGPPPGWLAWSSPVLFTVLGVGASLLAHLALRRVPGLFTLPSRRQPVSR